MATPTQRTLAALRASDWTVAVVERWNPHARVRQDLFGVVDILALRGAETLAVQACAYQSVSARVQKIAESEHIGALREAGWRIEVWGWRKGVRGERACRVVDVS